MTAAIISRASRALRSLEAPFALAIRLYVSWAFAKSGLLKLKDWDSTLFLFTEEYRVPLLPPQLAAVFGTAGELLFPALLALGFYGRLNAFGLFAVNALAVISYSHVLLSDGFEAAVAQHYLWGFMLLVLTIYGPGAWSADRLWAPDGLRTRLAGARAAHTEDSRRIPT